MGAKGIGKGTMEALGLGADLTEAGLAVADAVNAREGLGYNTLTISADAVEAVGGKPGEIDFEKMIALENMKATYFPRWDALLSLETSNGSRASFGAQLIVDGQNITGGFTFLSFREGYSKTGDQAGVDFSGVALRAVGGPPRKGTNTFVAHFLLIASGFQNPKGKGFQDFCVGIVIRADNRALLAFTRHTPPDQGDEQRLGEGKTLYDPLVRLRARKISD